MAPSVYWDDTHGVHHKQYLQDGILHISSEPLSVKNGVINTDITGNTSDSLESAKPLTNTNSASDALKPKK